MCMSLHAQRRIHILKDKLGHCTEHRLVSLIEVYYFLRGRGPNSLQTIAYRYSIIPISRLVEILTISFIKTWLTNILLLKQVVSKRCVHSALVHIWSTLFQSKSKYKKSPRLDNSWYFSSTSHTNGSPQRTALLQCPLQCREQLPVAGFVQYPVDAWIYGFPHSKENTAIVAKIPLLRIIFIGIPCIDICIILQLLSE